MTATYNARPGAKPGTIARVRFVRMSATKARAVLDLIRGTEVSAAQDILRFCERDAAIVIGKLLRSAIANAEHNDDQIAEDLFVSACYADEGRTIRRFRPRARGRATRIRKRTCHITIELTRLSEEQLERRRNRNASRPTSRTARRASQEAAPETTGRTRRRRTKTKPGAPATPATEQPQTAEEPTTPEPDETSQQTDEEVPPQAEETSTDENLGLFEDEAEASPEGSQPDAPASDVPPKADNDPGVPQEKPEET